MTATLLPPRQDANRHPTTRAGTRIVARGLDARRPDGTPALHAVSLTIEPGEVVAVIGASGAGKSTLLDALAGIRPAPEGVVLFEVVGAGDGTAGDRSAVGYVPQDDVIHRELTLSRTLEHAAALRLPPTTGPDGRRAAVEEVIAALDLARCRTVQVGTLSGGERKRASIAVELLTRPRALFLDEPTSGLDPATAATLVGTLRRLADGGSTVVFTTHSVQDLSTVDRLVVLAAGGRCVFSGSPADAHTFFGAATAVEIYERIETVVAAPTVDPLPPLPEPGPATAATTVSATPTPGAWVQAVVLTRRSAEQLVRNRLTLAILLGAPAMVIAMFAVLFQRGVFERAGSAIAPEMVAYWLAFAGFFFGLTYGLLQICVEVPVLRRERQAGLRLGAYLGSKLALLLPVLVVVDLTMLGVLRALGRLPDLGVAAGVSMAVTVALDALAGLCLGLLASAAVTSTAQAALALPMLCFPAVLFAGAVVPVPVMAPAGRAIAAVMSDRWAFEALARTLGVGERVGSGCTASTAWALLLLFAGAYLAVARLVLGRRAAAPRLRS